MMARLTVRCAALSGDSVVPVDYGEASRALEQVHGALDVYGLANLRPLPKVPGRMHSVLFQRVVPRQLAAHADAGCNDIHNAVSKGHVPADFPPNPREQGVRCVPGVLIGFQAGGSAGPRGMVPKRNWFECTCPFSILCCGPGLTNHWCCADVPIPRHSGREPWGRIRRVNGQEKAKRQARM